MISARIICARLAVVVALAAVSPSVATADVGPFDFKSREVKEGKNFAQRIIASLAVGKSSGNASYDFSFELPAGRGVTPALNLSYSSSSGVTEAGDGWALSVPMIERRYQHGVPTFTATDTFQYREGHTVYELLATGEVLGGWTVFREKSERSHSVYLRQGNSWRVLRTNGIRLELGTTASARRGPAAHDTFGNTAAWLITKQIDTHGNEATYTYETGRGIDALLARIDYTGNPGAGLLPRYRVDLDWDSHFGAADTRILSQRKGYREVFGRERLGSVTVTAPNHDTTGNPAKVPSTSPTSLTYTLTYQTTNPTAPAFRLSSIQVADQPPLQFTYETPWLTNTAIDTHETWGAPIDPYAMPRMLSHTVTDPLDFTRTQVTMADVHGDGLPDLIDTVTACENDTWVVWRNTGGAFIREMWSAPNLPVGDRQDRCAARLTERINDHTFTWQELADFDGDALPDVAFWQSTTTFLCRGNGSGFDPCAAWGTLPSGLAVGGTFRRENTTFANLTLTDVDLLDFNGDGFVDLVNSSTASPQLQVVLNDRGLGWGALISVNLPDCGVPGFLGCVRLSERVAQVGSNRRMLVETRDLNGDGLPDHVTTSLSTGTLQVSWGTGSNYGGSTPLTNGASALGLGRESSGGDYRVHGDLVDVNGDGLPDLVEILDGSDELRVRYNIGGSWEAYTYTYTLPIDPGGAQFSPRALGDLRAVDDDNVELRATFTDISGDGIPEFVSAEVDGGLGLTAPARIRLTRLPYRAPRAMLGAWSLAFNSAMRLTYAPHVGLPFPLHTVVGTRRERTPVYPAEPARQTMLETTYAYQDPVYDGDEREFRGFRQATETDQGYGTMVITNFLTGEHSAGLPESVTTSNVDAAGVPVTAISEYSEVPLSGGGAFMRLDRTVILDGTLFVWRTKETTYSDYAFGTPLEVVEDDPLRPTAQATSLIEQVVRRDSDHLLVVPSKVTRMYQGAIAAETRNYFDDRSIHGTAPTRGNLVRTRTRRNLVLSVDHEAYYDDELTAGTGALTMYVDPEGTAVSYGYEPLYRQYPTSEVTPVGTTYRSYHMLFGTIADVCGPQYLGTSHRCARTEIDHIGRSAASYVPTIQGGAFTMSKVAETLYDVTTYPLTVRQTLRPGAADEARSFTYLDGFGNVIQSRVEETSGIYRVVASASDALGFQLWKSQPARDSGSAYELMFDPGPQAARFEHDYVRRSVERTLFPRDDDDAAPQAWVSRVHEGVQITETDELGRETRHVLDGFGRTVERVHVASSGNAVYQYVYDRNSNLERVTDPNGFATAYTYNDRGWLLSVQHPDSSTHQFHHNDRGQVYEHVDPRGVVNRNEYDAAGRPYRMHTVTPVTGVTSVDETTTFYDDTTPAYLGWVATRNAGDVTLTLGYDAGGRPTTRTMSTTYVSATVTQSYTFDGRLDRVLFGDGWEVEYDYYLDGAAQRVSEVMTGRVLGEALLDDHGRPSVISSQLGLEHTFSYDARGRVEQTTSANVGYSSDPLVDDSFEWNDASELHQLTRHGLATGLVPRVSPDVFVTGRDLFGRLTSVTKNGAPFASYTVDLGGRLQTLNEGNGAFTYTYTHDRLMRRASSAGQVRYQYDAAGSARVILGGSATRAFAWDAAGRLAHLDVTVGTNKRALSYVYLAGELARVTSKSLINKEILHLGALVQYDALTAQYTDRVWLGPSLLCERRFGTVEYPHRTIGGSVAAISNEHGNILKQEEYYPYGRTSAFSGLSEHDQGFHGLRRDDLYVTGPRPYDHEAGRWLARDPMANVPSHWASMRELDSYGYAYARPFEYSDPSGLEPAVTGDPYFPEMDLAADQFVDGNGIVRRYDPTIPPEVQDQQRAIMDVPDVEEGLHDAVNGAVPYLPYVGPLKDIADGNIVEGSMWLAVDIFAGPAAARGAKLARNAHRARIAANAARAGCFAAGTLVTTADGPMAIEAVEMGDLVACSNTHGGWDMCEVAETLRYAYSGEVTILTIDGETLTVTPDHPFWVLAGDELEERIRPDHLRHDEPTSNGRGRWVMARELRPGDELEAAHGSASVTDLVRVNADLEVFNLVVESHRTFAVSELGVLVHNKPVSVSSWAAQISAKLPSSVKKRLECRAYAAVMTKALKSSGLKGSHNTILYRSGLLPYSTIHRALGDRGDAFHHFVRVGDTVFDNMNPNGIPYEQYVDDMGFENVLESGGEIISEAF